MTARPCSQTKKILGTKQRRGNSRFLSVHEKRRRENRDAFFTIKPDWPAPAGTGVTPGPDRARISLRLRCYDDG